MITQDQLKELLKYNPETGLFYWQKSSRWTTIHSVAGTTKDTYVKIRINGKNYYAHRLAWLYTYGIWPKGDIDHKNRDKKDNRLVNLREATRSQNKYNVGLTLANNSGHKGVQWVGCRQKWRVDCRVGGVQYYLGLFSTVKEANKVYNEFAKRHHGEFFAK